MWFIPSVFDNAKQKYKQKANLSRIAKKYMNAR